MTLKIKMEALPQYLSLPKEMNNAVETGQEVIMKPSHVTIID